MSFFLLITLSALTAIILLAAPVSASQVLTYTEFASSGTWYPPAGVTLVSLDICGAGSGAVAGGFGYNPSASSAISVNGVGGDAGTCSHYDNIVVTQGTTYTINIGNPGPENASWYFSATTNTSKLYNASPGLSSTALGKTASGGLGFTRNVTVTYNTISGWSTSYSGNFIGSDGFGTSQIAESGGTMYGSCTASGQSGFDGGNGYGAGGGGGAGGDWETGGATCAGGKGGRGASGYVKISYFIDSSSTTAWYSQQLVQLKIVDAYNNPIPLANVSVNYIASSLPSTNASFLVDAFGVSTSVADLMLNSSVAMVGNTDNQGALSFMMFPALSYGVTVKNTTLGVNNYVMLSPKDQYYQIKCPTTNQTAVTNYVNSTLSSQLLWYKLNSSYYNLSMIFHDASGNWKNVRFEVFDPTTSSTIYEQNYIAITSADTIITNYTIYVPLGREYIWKYVANDTVI